MPPCHFYNSPGGCRKGATCAFSHGTRAIRSSSPASSAGTGPGPSHQSPGPSPGSSRRRPAAGTQQAPPGVCNFYWTSGKCKREFDCRYRHTLPNTVPTSPSAPRLPDPDRSQPAIDTIAPFLTESGLAKVNASGTDAFFTSPTKALSPNEAHNALKRYLYDDFRFAKTFDVYGFLLPLSNANAGNSTWVSGEALR